MKNDHGSYRLRHNKAVERLAFVELLSRISRHQACDIRSYSYIGLGGPSLEDFRILHAVFAMEGMLSLERSEDTVRRQEFNRPHTVVDCKLQEVGSFVDEFEREGPTLVWLDYASPDEIASQIADFHVLLSKLDYYDICKITLNANPAALVRGHYKEKAEELHERRYKYFRDLLGEYFPSGRVEPRFMTNAGFPSVLTWSLEAAAHSAMEHSPGRRFFPLTAFRYADGQQMVTLTGIVLEPGTETDFLEKTSLADWPLLAADWIAPKAIRVPELTMRERLKIESMLPTTGPDDIARALGFSITDREEDSMDALRSYAELYRHVPFFSEIVT